MILNCQITQKTTLSAIQKNKIVDLKFKDEFLGDIITEFISLKLKLYSVFPEVINFIWLFLSEIFLWKKTYDRQFFLTINCFERGKNFFKKKILFWWAET